MTVFNFLQNASHWCPAATAAGADATTTAAAADGDGRDDVWTASRHAVWFPSAWHGTAASLHAYVIPC